MSIFILFFCETSYSQHTYKDSVTSSVKKITDYEKLLTEDTYITGKITDSASLSPIIDAHISIKGTPVTTTSDTNGMYKIHIATIPKNTDTLTVIYHAKDYEKNIKKLNSKALTNMFNIVDISLKSTLPKVVTTKKTSTEKKAPIHEHVLDKVKTFFKTLR